MDSLFSTNNTDTVRSSRIIYTPSAFARSSLLHLQETGTLQALHPHKSERSGLHSCLFFTVLSGVGRLIPMKAIFRLQDAISKKDRKSKGSVYCLVLGRVLREIPVAMRLGETPVPIPNTTVKT